MSALLQVRGLSAWYGATQVLDRLDLDVVAGDVTAVLGANGAGKTTLLRAVSGLVRTQGEVSFGGERIETLTPERIARGGIAHVPEGRGTLVDMTVEENLRVGAYTRSDTRDLPAEMERIFGYFPRLKERRRQQAGTLSGGEQQMLAIGRALMLKPRLLLMDEPSFGLAPRIIKEIFELMRQINRDERVSILLVEQNVARALDLSQHAYLLETGRIVMAGSAQAMRENDAIRRSYLGS
jgi:branched-chain amino acid transport system ATP-binding protein